MPSRLVQLTVKRIALALCLVGTSLIPGVCATGLQRDLHPASTCSEWNSVRHDLPTTTQLICWRRVLAGDSTSAVSAKALHDAESTYYTEVAATGDRVAAEIVGLLVNERERRSPPKGQHSKVFYGALLMSGQLERAAEEVKRKHLDVARDNIRLLPSSQMPLANEAAYWTFSGNGVSLTEHLVDLSKGAQVVVYSAPACGACLAAADELSRDSTLRAIFRDHAFWIDPPDFNYGSKYYGSWNVRFPQFPAKLIFDRRNWPVIEIPATPYFIFLKNGKVVARMIGWSKEKHETLKRDLMAIGFVGPVT